MAFRNDFLGTAGLRVDGRRPRELRRLQVTMGTSTHEVDGSAYFEMGQTKVLACVVGPREPTQRSRVDMDKAFVSCDLRVAPFAGTDRKVRYGGDRKLTEARSAIQRLFESVIMLHLYPRAQIDIIVQVLQMDGSPLCACVNAASLALIDAGVAMQDTVTACTAGYLDGTVVIDMNYLEMSSETPEMSVALLANAGKVVLSQMDCKVPLDTFGDLLSAATQGCGLVHEAIQNPVREHVEMMLDRSRE
uniref:Uncharacterized protein n=1 Tax=Phaeomonas parva TaxID=124430 RepID=A0A7S1XQ04_9STRA|mmetsp:Transcript_2294/g.6868  ORF Transcript_2294/g.6868 Transcript_2294/m.6868 type:complete len:247 (+) Transcript_2294:51-791(+)|eukprot:CAMPEP_0118866982 /NCGR_PEP_ID=MMETSP1163-20130328/10727_1 /TAXON_ID=124430 /ORGANISM="Phaeomonas parva, Strain CCMP2877" /LENGTH=246 /DNA_ID=CAMNT_0006801355 /DNA_START=25 /DNA_END=765 /DNA_ORIENTATION=+